MANGLRWPHYVANGKKFGKFTLGFRRPHDGLGTAGID
jgi:hypothetical protein